MTLNELEKSALFEIKSSLQYSLDSINDLLNNWNSEEYQISEIETLIHDWSNLGFDQFGHTEVLGRQNTEILRHLKVLIDFVKTSKETVKIE